MKFFLILISVFITSCSTVKSVSSGKVYQLTEVNGMLFIDVTINGVKTKLLIDTGASKSLLDISKAKEYGFEYFLFKKDQYIGLGGLIDIYVMFEYTVEEFFITFLGADLSEVQNYFRT